MREKKKVSMQVGKQEREKAEVLSIRIPSKTHTYLGSLSGQWSRGILLEECTNRQVLEILEYALLAEAKTSLCIVSGKKQYLEYSHFNKDAGVRVRVRVCWQL